MKKQGEKLNEATTGAKISKREGAGRPIEKPERITVSFDKPIPQELREPQLIPLLTSPGVALLLGIDIEAEKKQRSKMSATQADELITRLRKAFDLFDITWDEFLRVEDPRIIMKILARIFPGFRYSEEKFLPTLRSAICHPENMKIYLRALRIRVDYWHDIQGSAAFRKKVVRKLKAFNGDVSVFWSELQMPPGNAWWLATKELIGEQIPKDIVIKKKNGEEETGEEREFAAKRNAQNRWNTLQKDPLLRKFEDLFCQRPKETLDNLEKIFSAQEKSSA